MEHLRCVVERITYQNEENGYTVLKCAVKNYSDLVTVVGTMPDTHVGSVLSLDGFWKMNARYGRQFCAERFEKRFLPLYMVLKNILGPVLSKGSGLFLQERSWKNSVKIRWILSMRHRKN